MVMALCFTLAACIRTKTTLIKPPPCTVASWPKFPVVHLYTSCPTGWVCISDEAYEQIRVWLDQVDRYHRSLMLCTGQVTEAPDPR